MSEQVAWNCTKEYQVQWFERARFELRAEWRSANCILCGRPGVAPQRKRNEVWQL